ncbi:MAG: response regulator [Chthoniobacteraceae bacterium]
MTLTSSIPDVSNLKLLIVDDSMVMRRALTLSIQSSNFQEVRSAANGMLALKQFRDFLPDVVTLDLTMPELGGIEALEEMLKIKPETKIMIVSALADDATAIEALKKGAEQFICKPFTPEELNQALLEMLS